MMPVAEITLAGEQLVSGGIIATLTTIAGLLARRTKDTDEMRERLTQMALSHALEREGRAQADLDEVKAEAVDERRTAERLREQNAKLRAELARLRALTTHQES